MAEDSRRPYLNVTLNEQEVGVDIRSVTIEDHDRLIDKAIIVVDDSARRFVTGVEEGQIVKIELGWETEHAVLFEGMVTLPNGSLSGERHNVTITAYDLSYKMMQSDPKTRPHSGALTSIIRSIVGEYEIPVGEIQLDPDPEFPQNAPLRQTNKKDWQFIQDLAWQYGARAFVEYNDDRSQFYFIPESRLVQGDSMGTLTYCFGITELREFKYQRIANSAAAQRTATTVNPVSGETITSPPPAAANGAPPSPRDQQRPRQVVAGTPSDPNLPEQVTRQDPTRILGLYGEGKASGTIMLRAKGKVEILGIADWADGDWYVKKAVHKVQLSDDDSSYATEFIATR